MMELADPIIKYITKVHWTERIWIIITIIFGVSFFSSVAHKAFHELTIQTSLFYLWCIWGVITVFSQLLSAIIVSITQWYGNKRAPISLNNKCPTCHSDLEIRYTCPKCEKEMK